MSESFENSNATRVKRGCFHSNLFPVIVDTSSRPNSVDKQLLYVHG